MAKVLFSLFFRDVSEEPEGELGQNGFAHQREAVSWQEVAGFGLLLAEVYQVDEWGYWEVERRSVSLPYIFLVSLKACQERHIKQQMNL